jgi:hypothetical protein
VAGSVSSPSHTTLVGGRHSSAVLGVLFHGLGALVAPHAAWLAFVHLGQAVPLLMKPIREHVQTRG